MTATRDDIPIEQGERFSTTPEEAELLGRLWDRQLPGHLSDIPEKCPECHRNHCGLLLDGQCMWCWRDKWDKERAELEATVAELVKACWKLRNFASAMSDPTRLATEKTATLAGQLATEATAVLAKAGEASTIERTGYGDGTVVETDEPEGDCPQEKRP